jgi:hypothetical protein
VGASGQWGSHGKKGRRGCAQCPFRPWLDVVWRGKEAGEGGVGSRCGVGCETRQREGGLAHAVVRRGAGASNNGLGSGSVVLTCRTGKDARARGVRLGKEIGVWATFHGCGPVALGRPKGIVLFFIYSKKFKWI